MGTQMYLVRVGKEDIKDVMAEQFKKNSLDINTKIPRKIQKSSEKFMNKIQIYHEE